jgi:hypothetical protein
MGSFGLPGWAASSGIVALLRPRGQVTGLPSDQTRPVGWCYGFVRSPAATLVSAPWLDGLAARAAARRRAVQRRQYDPVLPLGAPYRWPCDPALALGWVRRGGHACGDARRGRPLVRPALPPAPVDTLPGGLRAAEGRGRPRPYAVERCSHPSARPYGSGSPLSFVRVVW